MFNKLLVSDVLCYKPIPIIQCTNVATSVMEGSDIFQKKLTEFPSTLIDVTLYMLTNQI